MFWATECVLRVKKAMFVRTFRFQYEPSIVKMFGHIMSRIYWIINPTKLAGNLGGDYHRLKDIVCAINGTIT